MCSMIKTEILACLECVGELTPQTIYSVLDATLENYGVLHYIDALTQVFFFPCSIHSSIRCMYEFKFWISQPVMLSWQWIESFVVPPPLLLIAPICLSSIFRFIWSTVVTSGSNEQTFHMGRTMRIIQYFVVFSEINWGSFESPSSTNLQHASPELNIVGTNLTSSIAKLI